MFKGFGQTYPEYEVITPQTGLSFTVRTLTVSDEENLKGSLLTPSKMIEHLTKCIYDSIVKKPKEITDFNEFKKKVTIKDRDALLFGLFHISYEEIRNYSVECSSCEHKHAVTIKASDTFNVYPYPEPKKILKERIKIKLDIIDYTITIKQPTLEDEIKSSDILNTSESNQSLNSLMEVLIIEKFEQNIKPSKESDPEIIEPIIYKEKNEIHDAYLALPSKDKRKIFNTYIEKFGKYCIELKLNVSCPKCGEKETKNIDLVENFFRQLHEL